MRQGDVHAQSPHKVTPLPRVLFLDHTGMLGGAELCLGDIARHFRERSRVVLLSDGPFSEWLRGAGVSVSVLAMSGALQTIRRSRRIPPLGAIPALWRTVRQVARMAKDYDVIYANSQKAFIVAALAGPLAGRRVVWHLHDILDYESFSRLNVIVDVFLANRVALTVIANSRACADAFVARGGKKDRVRVIYNGFDTAQMQIAMPAVVDRLRHELNIARGPVIGVFGRLAAWKGQEVALRALTDVREATLLIVGDALFGEEEYARSLRELAKRLGVADRVRFLGFRKDVSMLMGLVDVVQHTSVTPEPFGRVIVEAMFASRAIVATAAGGALEIVEQGVTGILIPPNDPAALSAATLALLDNPAHARRMGEAGRERALRLFTLSAVMPEIERVVARGVRE